MAEYIVKNRETGEVLFKGDALGCASVIGCDCSYVRKLVRTVPKTNTKYSMYKVERGGAHTRDTKCCGCGVLMENVSTSRKRCTECAREYSNKRKKQRMREIRGVSQVMPSPIRNPNAKYCEGCVYFGGDYECTKCCNYIFVNGERRPCPPGKDCTVKIERERYREKKERSTDIS